MPNKIRSSLDCITAENDLKSKTIHAVTTAMGKQSRGLPPCCAAALAACLTAVLLLGGCGMYFTPVSAISVDINPSLELSVNRFDRVVDTVAFNEDGEALLSAVSLQHKKYEDAVSLLLNCDMAKTYLSDDAEVSITVLGHTEMHSAEMLQRIEACNFITAANVFCHSANRQTAEAAHHAHLSLGKYEAYLALRALDSTVTEDDVRDLSMYELRLLIEALGGEVVSSSNSSGHGTHHSNGNHH